MANYPREPQPLKRVLSELIALRGLARTQSRNQLQDVWQQIAGEKIAAMSRPAGLQRGTLMISVENAPLLAQLRGFYQQQFLAALQAHYSELNIKQLKFQLKSRAASPLRDPSSAKEPS